MAIIEDQWLVLRDGRRVVMGTARGHFARGTRDLMAHALATSPYLIKRPDEYDITIARQKAWIRRMARSANEVCLIAHYNNQVIAMLDSVVEARARLAHVTQFGLVVDPAWQGAGLGRAMVLRFIDWVRCHPTLEKIELHHHATNNRAARLYSGLGFIEEGRRKRAIRHDDGTYIDDVLMGLVVTEAAQMKDPSSIG